MEEQDSEALSFRTVCRKNGLPIVDSRLELLKEYVLHLLDWNRKINLISRKDVDNIWGRHILGSVSFLFRRRLQPGSSFIDIGTGGGLPGIPIAILWPDLHGTLIDSIQKKVKAVVDIVEKLSLENVEAVCGRAEALSLEAKYHRSFDYVIARAVGSVEDLIRWGMPFLKTVQANDAAQKAGPNVPPRQESYGNTFARGSILLLKGGELDKELEDARNKTGPRRLQAFTIRIEGADASDSVDKKLVVIEP